jgi:hypothetical protein
MICFQLVAEIYWLTQAVERWFMTGAFPFIIFEIMDSIFNQLDDGHV